jgi:hypothetical protein
MHARITLSPHSYLIVLFERMLNCMEQSHDVQTVPKHTTRTHTHTHTHTHDQASGHFPALCLPRGPLPFPSCVITV